MYCLGKCYAAPASGDDEKSAGCQRALPPAGCAGCIASGGALKLEAYRDCGGLIALEVALAEPADRLSPKSRIPSFAGIGGGRDFLICKERRIVASRYRSPNNIRGQSRRRGFLCLRRPNDWRARPIRLAGRDGHRGDVGRKKGWIYVRCEYPQAVAMLREAIALLEYSVSNRQAFSAMDLRFEVELVVGRGSHARGEETAMLNAMEASVAQLAPARRMSPSRGYSVSQPS